MIVVVVVTTMLMLQLMMIQRQSHSDLQLIMILMLHARRPSVDNTQEAHTPVQLRSRAHSIRSNTAAMGTRTAGSQRLLLCPRHKCL